MIELSSPEPLGDTAGEVQLIRGGTAEPALRRPLKLRTREDDKSIVVAEATLDLSALPPGSYTASAVIQKNGAPIARVSRVFEILAGHRAGTCAGFRLRHDGSARNGARARCGARAWRGNTVEP